MPVTVKSGVLDRLIETSDIRSKLEHPFFKALSERLDEAPVWLYEMDDVKHQRNHLTSFFRYIALREYENKIIQDLYYIHELCHCAQWQPSLVKDYDEWMGKLSVNELFASLCSEVLVYKICPEINGKTFSPLWANRFLNNINDLEQTTEWLDLKGWSPKMISIINERMKLRFFDGNHDLLGEDEKKIVAYNNLHERWLKGWGDYYLKIDEAMLGLFEGTLSSDEYEKIININKDEYGRPFFPKIAKKAGK